MRRDRSPTDAEVATSASVTVDTLTEAQIHWVLSRTADSEISGCCRSALGVGSPIWMVRQAAREAVAEAFSAMWADRHGGVKG